jgi:hypothetical protein
VKQGDVALTGEFAIVDQAVREHASCFSRHGFQLTGVTLPGSARLPRFPVFHFQNKRTFMDINVSFYAAPGRPNRGFNVLIVKPVNRKLNLEDYLKLHGRDDLAERFSCPDLTVDLREFAEAFLDMLCGLLDKELQPILEGKTFEETPIDWMGYK